MMLSNVTEPGGILRRRGRDDELSMRGIFQEDDVVVAEVQRVSPDGVASLHTRTAEKYGKMTAVGRLVAVRPTLIRRAKHQFHTMIRFGLTLIIGVNGRIWVQRASAQQLREAADLLKRRREAMVSDSEVEEDGHVDADPEHEGSGQHVETDDPVEVHNNVARVCNTIRALGEHGCAINHHSIGIGARYSVDAGWKPFDVLSGSHGHTLAQHVKHSMASSLKRVRAE